MQGRDLASAREGIRYDLPALPSPRVESSYDPYELSVIPVKTGISANLQEIPDQVGDVSLGVFDTPLRKSSCHCEGVRRPTAAIHFFRSECCMIKITVNDNANRLPRHPAGAGFLAMTLLFLIPIQAI